MNAWLKRCVFNLDLNRESVSEPRTLSGRLFQSLGAKYEKVLPPLVDFAILCTTFTFMHLADAFIQSDFQCIQVIHLLSVCVPWELSPRPLRC